jgi:O-methyltransferase
MALVFKSPTARRGGLHRDQVRERLAGMINRWLISTIGIRITSARATGVDESWFDRLLYLNRVLSLVEGIPGDVVECGVSHGHSLAMIAALLRSTHQERCLWGFDCWAGLPPPGSEDLEHGHGIARSGVFSGASIESVLTTLRWFGFSDEAIAKTIMLRQGLFRETLAQFPDRAIALLHIDVDLYQSYKECLAYLWTRVVPGGVVALDEYHDSDDWPGAKRAVDEFLSTVPPETASLHQDTGYGRYLILKTTAGTPTMPAVMN